MVLFSLRDFDDLLVQGYNLECLSGYRVYTVDFSMLIF